MPDFPLTRNSLLLRLRDVADAEAWEEFSAIYRPVVYGMARRRGLQDSDAQDLAQAVLMSVSSAINRWDDAGRGRFRTWLSRVVRNAIIDEFRRSRLDAGHGGTSVLRRLGEHPDGPIPNAHEMDFEIRRQVFRWAAKHVRNEFEEATWLAFWMSTAEGKSTTQVAQELNKTAGAVYAARARIIRRLKEKIREYEDD